MRPLATITLAVVLALGSAGSTVSQETDNPKVRYCNAGLERSINVCNNIHDVGSTGWDKCLAYTASQYRMCMADALDHMDTVGG